jgi:hypothetical protein
VGLTPTIKLLYSLPKDPSYGDFLTGHDIVMDELVDVSNIYENIDCFGEPDTGEEEIFNQGIVVKRDGHRVEELKGCGRGSSRRLGRPGIQPRCNRATPMNVTRMIKAKMQFQRTG